MPAAYTCGTLLVAACAAGAAAASHPRDLPVGPMAPRHVARAPRPFFSWDTIPTSFHGARKDAAYTHDEVRRLAKYNVLCLEKWYTPCGAKGPTQSGPSCAVEEKMAALFKQTKAIAPNQTTIMYWNSMLDFSFYRAHAKMEDLEARGVHVYLRDKTGTILSLCNDGNVYCNMTTFDWTQPAARQVWVEAITNMTATGYVDGIYADHSAEKGVGIGSNFNFTKKGNGVNQLCNGVGAGRACYNFTTAFAASFNSWHYWSTNYTQDLLANTTGGPVIAGPLANMGIPCTFDGIRDAQRTSGLTMLEVNCGCAPSKQKIVQFLAAAEQYNYAHCMGNYNDGTMIGKTTFPEMAYRLGAPNGPAEEVPGSGSGVWHRTFASGAWVIWDNNAKNGTYHFPGQPQPPPPSPPSPLPAACGKVLLNTGVKGGNIGTWSNVATAGACCARCTGQAREAGEASPHTQQACAAWAWHRDTNHCHAVGGNATTHTVQGCDAGIIVQRARA